MTFLLLDRRVCLFVVLVLVVGGSVRAQCDLTCPSPITMSNDPNQCGAVTTYAVPTDPGCDNIMCSPASGSFFPVGTTTVTCTGEDETPAATTSPPLPGVFDDMCTFTVTINDTQPPTATCPANGSFPNDLNLCGAVLQFGLMPSDNCPGVTFLCSPPSGSFFPVGTTTTTCTSTDASGNTSTCSFTETVNDTQAPVIDCGADVEAFSPGAIPISVIFPPPSASDNCPGVVTMDTPASGSIFPLGVTTVTCKATDAASLMATDTLNVTVDFPIAPIPSLSTVGIVLLALGLGVVGWRMLR